MDKVLIVDDTPENVSVLYEFLMMHTLEVLVALSAENALQILKYEIPSLILLDVMMPKMDGFEFCSILKNNEKYCDIPIIFMTSLSDITHKIKGFELGAVDYVTKPLQREEVLARINTHLTIRRLQKTLQQKNNELEKKKAELQAANEHLERLANLDGLTQVANRRVFDYQLEAEWQRLAHEKKPLSLVLCDVDFFKFYNDHYGHLEGDQCLRLVATTLKKELQRPADVVARYGGEEFALILPDTSLAAAEAVAQHIQAQLKCLKIAHQRSEVSQYITLSIGIACIHPSLGVAMQSLIAAADKALYQAKTNGRNQIVSLTLPALIK